MNKNSNSIINIKGKNIYLLLLIVVSLITMIIIPTYAKFSNNYTTESDIAGINLNYNIGITNIEEYEEINVDKNSYEVFNIEVENSTNDTLYYGIWYKMLNPKELNDNIIIAKAEGTDTLTTDSIEGTKNKTVSIVVKNMTNSKIKINIGVSSSTTSTNDIEYLNNKHLITGETKAPVPLTKHIIDLYNDGSNINTVHIGGDDSNPEVSLNNTQSIMLDNNGEYRYYGSTPNNYVLFNNELWRIISVSNIKSNELDTVGSLRVKLIRNESIGNYSWDSSDETVNIGRGVNDWTEADLNTLLNDYYYNGKDNQTCYNEQKNSTTECSFSNVTLSNNTKKLIDTAVWYLGGINDLSPLAHLTYNLERGVTVYNGRPTTWTGKIGLMYPSDYGYATDLRICTDTLYNYHNSNCKENNWLANTSTSKWTITPSAKEAWDASSISSTGTQFYNAFVYHDFEIYPTVYLKPNTEILKGTGTDSDPYIISKA